MSICTMYRTQLTNVNMHSGMHTINICSPADHRKESISGLHVRQLLAFVLHYHYHCIGFAISIAIAVDIAIALILPLSLLNRVYIHVVITGAKMHNGGDSHCTMG